MSKNGRPTKYKEEYCEEIVEFFNVAATKLKTKEMASAGKAVSVDEEVPTPIPTLERFASSIGVCRDTLHEWTRKYPSFSDAYKRAKDLQASIISENASVGLYNTTWSIFFMKCNHGWKESDTQTNQNINITIDGKDEQL